MICKCCKRNKRSFFSIECANCNEVHDEHEPFSLCKDCYEKWKKNKMLIFDVQHNMDYHSSIDIL